MIRRIGLTGGVASGKSTVAEQFMALGAPVIDTDRIARDLTAPGALLTKRIFAEFGTELCAVDGSLNRRKLRERVFADPQQRRKLEGLLHPAIADRMETEVSALTTSTPYVVLMIPLLLEAGWQNQVDTIVVVDCPPDVQIERLRQRDGVTLELAQDMIAAQTSRDRRLAAADFVVTNSRQTSLDMLREQVRQLDCELSGRGPG
jgi:dephospho-CoA kinase